MRTREKAYHVYIMTNRSKTLYTGITGKLHARVFEHKTGANEGFTKKYQIDRLVYWEQFKNVHSAIAREKQIKGWRRLKKIELIVSMNPTWTDLAADWYP
ncbi:MAG TPA: GIY-YIG nuclease family protein [Candidatus Angelobacter sp.]|jgi:putative endonuclease